MRKFKHKKLGWIAEYRERLEGDSIKHEYMIFKKDSSCCIKQIDYTLPIKLVENSADWEEIVEKDWEVVSVVSQTSDEVLLSKGNERFGRDGICSLKYMLTGGVWLINSVKHLPTNKVWTLKDKTQFGTIEKFDIENGECIAYFIIKNSRNCYSCVYYPLSELNEPKEEKCYPKGIVSFKFSKEWVCTKPLEQSYNEFVEENLGENNTIYEVTNGTDNFRVGDEIVANYGMPKRIKSFSIIDGEIQAVYDYLGGTMEACKELSKLVKYEQPKVTVKYEQPINACKEAKLEAENGRLKKENEELKGNYNVLESKYVHLKSVNDTLWNQYKHLLGLTK